MDSNEPYLLHIESSRARSSVAISFGNECLYHKVDLDTYRHAQMLPILVQEAIEDLNLPMHKLSAMHLCIGPGSYTALRVSVTLAKSLSLVLPIQLIASSSFQIAKTLSGLGQSVALVTQYARKGEVYASILDSNQDYLIEPTTMPTKEKELLALCDNYGAEWIHIGKVETVFSQTEIRHINDFTALDLIDLGYASFQQRNFIDKYDIVPLYIKPPHITSPRRVLPRR